MRDLLLLALTLAVVPIAFFRPTTGILAYYALGTLGLHSYAWGVAAAFPHVQAVGLATLLGSFFSRRLMRAPRGSAVTIMCLLWATFALSTIFALRPEAALSRFLFVSKLFIMMFLATALLTTQPQLHGLVRAISLPLGFHGVKLGIFVLFTGLQQKAYGPEETYLWGENSIGTALATNLSLLTYLWRTDPALPIRWLARIAFLLSFPAVLGTFSRGAWISLAVASFFLIVHARRRIFVLLVASAAVTTAIAQPDLLLSDRFTARFATLLNYQSDTSAQARLWNWEFCRRVGFSRPLGGGFDFYSVDAYLRFYPEFAEHWPGKVWSCHSFWLTYLAEHGLIGFLLGSGILAACLLTLRRIRRSAAQLCPGSPPAHLAPMLAIALATFAAGGTFLDVAYFELLYQLIAAVIILNHVSVARQDHPNAPPAIPLSHALPAKAVARRLRRSRSDTPHFPRHV